MSTQATPTAAQPDPARPLSFNDVSPDWGVGRYETFASELEPAAERVIALAQPRASEETLDLACGTGNAAMLAARAGANVTGLDGSPRLIEVARARAQDENVDAAFVVGDLHELPFADGAFELVVSVFGVIFARDARAALAEIVRVLAPSGRALVSIWEPSAVGRSLGAICGQALGDVLGAALPRFEWSDQADVTQVAAELGATARFHHGGDIVFTADSPERYLATQEHDHPLVIGARRLLERAGTWEATRDQLLRAVHDQNEEPGAFRTRSRYTVIEIRHDGGYVAAAAGGR